VSEPSLVEVAAQPETAQTVLVAVAVRGTQA
jgi:hypothetical protein